MESGYINVPYIIKDVTGPSPEYDEFMSKYRNEHALCPVCGAPGHVHTAHDRKPKI